MNPAFDARDFRDAVGWFATGVTVITARGSDNTLYGVTANSFTSVSLDPPLVLWSLDKRSPSSTGFAATDHFAVNILAQDQQGLSARFATTGPDKWRDIAHESWETGAPILPGSLASLDCRVEAKHDGGDEVIGDDVVDGGLLLDHLPLQEEVEISVVVHHGILAPVGNAGLVELPVHDARLDRLHVVLEGSRLVLAGGLGQRKHLPEDAH